MLPYRDMHKTTDDDGKHQSDCVTNLSKTMKGLEIYLT